MNVGFLYAALAGQGLLMVADECIFHRRRGLGPWERWGHPLDSLVFFLALGAILIGGTGLTAILLSIASCLVITKDEWIHRESCSGAESWLHAMLFLFHPVILIFAFLTAGQWGFEVPLAVLAFSIYQIFYWNIYAQRAFPKRPATGQ